MGTDADRGLSLQFDGREIRPEVIVGADGANGTTVRALGLGGPVTHGVAFEGNAAFDERYRGLAVIELGTIPGGYGWVFPKGDHVNVGVGGWEAEGPRLRQHLAELCRRHGIDGDALESVRGHRLPLRRSGFVAARGRAILVGDAAGLVDPLTGDGMYEAFVSARLASAAALDVLAGRAETVDAVQRPPRPLRSARSPTPPGARRSPSTAIRARRSRSRARRSSGRWSSGSSEGTSARRRRHAVSPGRR